MILRMIQTRIILRMIQEPMKLRAIRAPMLLCTKQAPMIFRTTQAPKILHIMRTPIILLMIQAPMILRKIHKHVLRLILIPTTPNNHTYTNPGVENTTDTNVDKKHAISVSASLRIPTKKGLLCLRRSSQKCTTGASPY